MPEPVQILQVVELTALKPFIVLDLFLQLEMERLQRVDHALDLFVLQPRLFQSPAMLGKTRALFRKSCGRFLVFRLIANHAYPPYLIFTMPLGSPSRRDCRKAEGNSNSWPNLSRMPLPSPSPGICGYSSTRYRCHIGSCFFG